MRIFMLDPSNFTLPYDSALAGALAKLGHAVTLFGRPFRTGEAVDQDTFEYRTHFYRLSEQTFGHPRLRSLSKAVEHVIDFGRLMRLAGRDRPDVVHIQWSTLPLIDALYVRGLAARFPVVMTLHDSNPFNDTPSSSLQLAGYNDVVRSAHRLIVHSDASVETWAARGVDPGRIVTIPHGVLGFSSSGERRRGSPDPDGRLKVVLFGKMRPYKGIDLLLEAVAQLEPNVRSKLRFIIAGEPLLDLGPIQAFIASNGLSDTVELRPKFYTDEEIQDLFGEADAFVFPYRQIDASGVFFLSLLYGKPIIASDIGCFRDELVHGETGLLAPAGDTRALADNLALFAENGELRSHLSTRIRNLDPDRYSWSRIAERTVGVYKDAKVAAETPLRLSA